MNKVKGLTNMIKKNIGLAVVAAVCIGAWVGGCEEEQAAPDVKMSRLISAENRQLKAEIAKQKEQLARCEKDKQDAQKGQQEQIKKMMEMSISAQTNSNAEIGRLRAEVATLKKGKCPESPQSANQEELQPQESMSPPPPPPANQEEPQADSASSPQTDENVQPPPPPPPSE